MAWVSLSTGTAIAIDKALFPERGHEIPFFVDGPRTIFAHLLKYRPTPEQLCRWLSHPTRRSTAAWLERHHLEIRR